MKRFLFLLLASSLLFLGYYRNQWQAARPKKFNTFQKDVESYILARMVISRQSGLLSYGGPLGWGVAGLIFAGLSVCGRQATTHTHMNHLPWQMPFTLFGFALVGFVLQQLFRQPKNLGALHVV